MDDDVEMGNGAASAAATPVKTTAPVLPIPQRYLAAVEHPAFLTSLQRGIDSFAGREDYADIVQPSGPQSSTAVFLRPEDPASSGLSSHCASSHNLVVAVHVPKRTGMRRKRGTNDAWEHAPGASNGDASSGDRPPGDRMAERDARRLRKRLQETVGRYRTEVIGISKHSHRYRGVMDFQQSTHDSDFMTKFTETVLPGELSKLRNFSLTPGVSKAPGVDLPPPPFFTSHSLPFPYSYTQNPFVREVVSGQDGAVRLVNSTAATPVAGYLLSFDSEVVPTTPPPGLAPIVGRRRQAILDAMRQALQERPVWTRRALINQLSAEMRLPFTENRLKQYFAHCCYQFKGGPWRDTLVRYGVDPRTDPSFGQYQTLLFKLHRQDYERKDGSFWHSLVVDDEDGEPGGGPAGGGDDRFTQGGIRKVKHVATPLTLEIAPAGEPTWGSDVPVAQRKDTHIFDGSNYCDDGKIWQVCDLHDPVLRKLLQEAPPRPTCERMGSGWYHQGTWAQARAIMKIRLLAIRFGRLVDDARFEPTLAVPPQTPKLAVVRNIKIPVPNLELTPEETAVIAQRVFHGRPKKRARHRGVTSMTMPIFTERRGDPAADEAGGGGQGATKKDTTQADGRDEGEDDEDDDDEADIEDLGDDDEADEDGDDNDGDGDDDDDADEDGDEDDEDEEDEEEDEDGDIAERIAIKEEILDDMDQTGLGV